MASLTTLRKQLFENVDIGKTCASRQRWRRSLRHCAQKNGAPVAPRRGSFGNPDQLARDSSAALNVALGRITLSSFATSGRK